MGLLCRWLSKKYRTLTMSMLVAQDIELFTLALFGITIILIPNKGPKHRTVRLNTGHLATLNMKYINRPPYLTTWIRHCFDDTGSTVMQGIQLHMGGRTDG